MLNSFPSLAHLEMLRNKAAVSENKKGKPVVTGYDLTQLDRDERFQYHAYDYGWRRHFLFSTQNYSPIDPDKLWFAENLADQTHAFWKKLPNPMP